VVLQVAAHAGQVVRHGDAELLQIGGRADARELQQLREPKAPAERITSRRACTVCKAPPWW
jgi:hypothetical protein